MNTPLLSMTLRGRPTWPRTACVAVLALSLTGCATTNRTEEMGSGDQAAADAKGIAAKGGTTAASTYVDPYVSTNPRQMQAARQPAQNGQAAPGEVPATGAPVSDGSSGSLAGLATQPTGVRAGSFSIFSAGTASAQPPQPAMDDPAVPATAATAVSPSGQVNAATRSVFSSSAPPATAGCGLDQQGQPLSC